MSESNKYIVVKPTNEGLFLNPAIKIDWTQINFPSKEHFTFNPHRSIYWCANMLSFDKKTSRLSLEIVDFEPENIEDFEIQKAKYPVNSLEIHPFNWNLIKNALSHYNAQGIRDAGFDIEYRPIEEDDLTSEHSFSFDFLQAFSKLEFKMGYVQTTKSIKGLSKNLVIKIPNPYIIPEFEYVKPFFSKILDTKKVRVRVRIGDKNDRASYSFSSPEIARINEDMIEGVKRLELKRKISKNKILAIDKSLFSPDEYFDGLEATLGNNLRKSDRELLMDIIQFEGAKNRIQLHYIAGKIQSNQDKIMFTLTPKFGFLFYYLGQEMNHYIWELLDSNATYVWSFDRLVPKEKSMSFITSIINFIRQNGRLQYLANEKNADLIFSKINHESSGSHFVDSFPKWSKRLNEKLV